MLRKTEPQRHEDTKLETFCCRYLKSFLCAFESSWLIFCIWSSGNSIFAQSLQLELGATPKAVSRFNGL